MAPAAKYLNPLEQLTVLLRDARERGVPFDAAWVEAVRPGRPVVMTTTAAAPAGAVRWPTDRTDRMAWQAAVLGSREAWGRAYRREAASPADLALETLGEGFRALDAVAAARAAGEGMRRGSAVASAA